MTDILTGISIAAGGGLTAGSLLILLLKLLERRVARNEKAIADGVKRHYKGIGALKSELNKKIDEQEDCWEDEIQKVNISIGVVHNDVQKVITVMQMQSVDPKVVEILKGGI